MGRIQLTYQNHTGGPGWYGSPAQLARAANTTVKAATKYLESQDSYISNRRRVGKFPRRRIFSPAKDHIWQADILQFPGTKNKKIVHQGLRYALTVIDVVSKFLWAVPLTHKDGKSVANAFDQICQLGRSPTMLQTDRGKEFVGQEFRKVLKARHIHWYATHSVIKASIIERSHRTLMTRLFRYLSGKHKKRLSLRNALAAVIRAYNRSYHRSIGMAPADVSTPEAEKKALAKLYPPEKKTKPVYRLGDVVRVVASKTAYAKGYRNTFARPLYKIIAVKSTKPPTYQLEELKSKTIVEGGFYREELARTKS